MSLDEFLNQNRPLVVSSAWLVMCILLAGYVFIQENQRAIRYDLTAMTNTLNQEADEYKALVDKSEQDKKVVVGVKTIPEFLSNINAIAQQNDLIIRQLMPDDETKSKYNIELITDYYTFLKFTADLESLDTVINDMQIRPYGAQKKLKGKDKNYAPQHFITFSITPHNNARKLDHASIKDLNARVKQALGQRERNPLQRLVWVEGALSNTIDLTWLHKLTGIGSNNKGRYATIDRLDYYEGATFGENMKVVSIQGKQVNLASKDGLHKFVLKFRKRGRK